MWLWLLFIGLVVCGALVYLQSQFSRMGEARVKAAVDQASSFLEKGRIERAEATLYRTMHINGWDYLAYVNGKKTNKSLNIELVVPQIVQLARSLKVLPEKNFEGMIPAFLLLERIYVMQGKGRKALRLVEDLLNFMDGYGGEISFVRKSQFLAAAHADQALLEHQYKNYSSSLKLHAMSYLENLAAMKGAGNEEGFNREFPFKGDEMMMKNLVGMSRESEAADVVEIINKTVHNSPGRINPQILDREMEVFLGGSRKAEGAGYAAARDIIQIALTKASGGNKDKPEPPPEKKDTIIIE